MVGQNHLVGPGSSAPAFDGLGNLDGACQDEAKRQVEHLRAVLATRQACEVEQELARLRTAAGAGDNVTPAMIEAARARATIGEMTEVLAGVPGRHQEADTA